MSKDPQPIDIALDLYYAKQSVLRRKTHNLQTLFFICIVQNNEF